MSKHKIKIKFYLKDNTIKVFFRSKNILVLKKPKNTNYFYYNFLVISRIDVFFTINWQSVPKTTLHSNTYVNSGTSIYPSNVIKHSSQIELWTNKVEKYTFLNILRAVLVHINFLLVEEISRLMILFLLHLMA